MLTTSERTSRNAVLATVAVWGAAVVAASASGLLRRLPGPVFGALILTGIAVPTVVYLRSVRLQKLAAKIGVARLTAFQGWRIIAGIWFVWMVQRGALPAGFGLKAGWGDVIAGVAGLAAAWLWPRRAGYALANVIGLGDFVVAVGTGMATTLADQASMHANSELPGALIPLFGVGITATSQIIAMHLLWKERREPAVGGLPEAVR
jgi:hypothetical protein